jgi:hypothetical protein
VFQLFGSCTFSKSATYVGMHCAFRRRADRECEFGKPDRLRGERAGCCASLTKSRVGLPRQLARSVQCRLPWQEASRDQFEFLRTFYAFPFSVWASKAPTQDE